MPGWQIGVIVIAVVVVLLLVAAILFVFRKPRGGVSQPESPSRPTAAAAQGAKQITYF
jgi:hypothetical protein